MGNHSWLFASHGHATTCTNTHIHTYIHIIIHTDIHTYVHTYTHEQVPAPASGCDIANAASSSSSLILALSSLGTEFDLPSPQCWKSLCRTVLAPLAAARCQGMATCAARWSGSLVHETELIGRSSKQSNNFIADGGVRTKLPVCCCARQDFAKDMEFSTTLLAQ